MESRVPGTYEVLKSYSLINCIIKFSGPTSSFLPTANIYHAEHEYLGQFLPILTLTEQATIKCPIYKLQISL